MPRLETVDVVNKRNTVIITQRSDTVPLEIAGKRPEWLIYEKSWSTHTNRQCWEHWKLKTVMMWLRQDLGGGQKNDRINLTLEKWMKKELAQAQLEHVQTIGCF